MIDLNPKYLKTVQYILAEHVPEYEIRAFGSRVKWTSNDYSDLDIAVVGSKPLTPRQKRILTDAFDESNLPIRVDIVDWQTAPERFRQVILEKYVTIQKPKINYEIEEENGTQDRFKKDEWKIMKFGDCATLIRDSVSPSKLGDTPYIGLEHIGQNTLYLIGQGKASAVTSTKSRFKQNDILFGKLNCHFRKVVKAPFDGICSTDIWVTRAKVGVDQNFLFYCMASQEFIDYANSGAEGTTLPRAKWEWVSRYKVPLPPLPIQQHIVRILSSFDDKIQLNRQMNETLEETASAIFKSWFVDFDPVYAKLEGKNPIGMDYQTAAMFPSEFEESPLGKIPRGWKVTTFGEEFNITMGQSPPSSTYNEDGSGIPFFQGSRDFKFRFPKRRVYCTAPKRFAKKGDTLVSVRAPVGDINMVNEECSIGRGVAAIHHKTGSRSFTFYILQSLHSIFSTFEAEGTVFGAINKTDLSNILLVKPTENIIGTFENIIYPLDEFIKLNDEESITLAETRDMILPKLLSGKLRVEGLVKNMEVKHNGIS